MPKIEGWTRKELSSRSPHTWKAKWSSDKKDRVSVWIFGTTGKYRVVRQRATTGKQATREKTIQRNIDTLEEAEDVAVQWMKNHPRG